MLSSNTVETHGCWFLLINAVAFCISTATSVWLKMRTPFNNGESHFRCVQHAVLAMLVV